MLLHKHSSIASSFCNGGEVGGEKQQEFPCPASVLSMDSHAVVSCVITQYRAGRIAPNLNPASAQTHSNHSGWKQCKMPFWQILSKLKLKSLWKKIKSTCAPSSTAVISSFLDRLPKTACWKYSYISCLPPGPQCSRSLLLQPAEILMLDYCEIIYRESVRKMFPAGTLKYLALSAWMQLRFVYIQGILPFLLFLLFFEC